MKVKYLSIVLALSLGVLLTLASLLMTGQEACASYRVLYVDRDASGPIYDGLSWTTAFTELQTARGIALSGDEIWVAEGIYYPDYDPGSGRYTGYVTATFRLQQGLVISMYGGFAGTETSREQRDWTVNQTVLSGDLDRNDTTDAHGVITTTQHITGTNAWSVVSVYGMGAVLDGFVVTGGNANGHEGEWWDSSCSGGGMYIAGVPTVRNMIFSGNAARSDGGGMFASLSIQPTLTNVSFVGNSAGTGGGMSTWGGRPLLINTLFTANSASSGGALHNIFASHPTLINVTFFSNTANSGGAIANHYGSSSVLTNCILWGNTTSSPGAQIYNTVGCTSTISHSDVQGSGGSGAGWDTALGTDGGGNIDADPLFLNVADGNLRLWILSPAVDAGDNSAVPSGVVTDADGNPRFVDIPIVSDTGAGPPPIVDMGAYEVQSSGATYARLDICTDENWYEPSTGQPARIQPVGPAPGSIYDIPGAAPIWGQDAGPYSSTALTRSFTIPVNAASITGMVTFVADDGVTLTLNAQQVGNYDAMTWPPPTIRTLTNLQPGANEFRAAVYNRPGGAWFEACAVIVYEQWRIYVPVVLRGY